MASSRPTWNSSACNTTKSGLTSQMSNPSGAVSSRASGAAALLDVTLAMRLAIPTSCSADPPDWVDGVTGASRPRHVAPHAGHPGGTWGRHLGVPGHEVGDGQPRLIAGEPPSGVWLVEGPHPFGG